MKTWEKGKKDFRHTSDRENQQLEIHKKRKLKPAEKEKYRTRGYASESEE
jgi:hypothetical protein